MNNNKIINIKPLGFPWATQDPFLFCAHHDDKYPKGNSNMEPDASLEGRNIGNDFTIKDGWRMYHGSTIPGFPNHPHRGFETITITKKGLIDHADSLGGAGRYGNGDVQWLTSGKGVQHSEMFPLLNTDKENPLEIFQVWINLPKAKKFAEPHFSMLWADKIPLVIGKDAQARLTEINIIAGQLNNVSSLKSTPDSWAANPDNEVAVWTIKMQAHAEWILPKAKTNVNRTLYFYKGNSLTAEGENVPSYHSIELKPNEDIKLQSGDEESYLLLLQGKPIDENVAQYGPFVMNTQEEIRQAMRDYQETQFGGWPWPRHDQVHDRKKGRFALFADGQEEVKFE